MDEQYFDSHVHPIPNAKMEEKEKEIDDLNLFEIQEV
jgi:hypothetical protein